MPKHRYTIGHIAKGKVSISSYLREAQADGQLLHRRDALAITGNEPIELTFNAKTEILAIEIPADH